jgi:hypothetical protein
VLIAGTITALSFPSFMITGAAQAQPYYDDDRMYNDYNSYGPTDYYRDDKDKKYDDSYGYSDYGMDSSYDNRKSYDNKKSYGNDNGYYESQYLSYKPDYKPKHPSYDDKDDKRDKSKKDSKKSISLNKVKCINDNININGGNAGDINVGNKEQVTPPASLFGNDARDNDGYNNKKDKNFDCVVNNDNENRQITLLPTEPTPPSIPPIPPTPPEPPTCEECFTDSECNTVRSLTNSIR